MDWYKRSRGNNLRMPSFLPYFNKSRQSFLVSGRNRHFLSIPFELIIKLRSRKRVAVRQVQTTNNYAINKCFDVSAMGVLRVFVKSAVGFLDLAATG